MIDLSKISKVAMDVGLTVTSHLTDITFNYIPEIEYDEPVDMFVLQRYVEGGGYEPGISCVVIKRKNGETYLLGILESDRYEDAWRYLDHEDYSHFVNKILPAYNIGITDSYVRKPIMATAETSPLPSTEFFYCIKLEFPDISDMVIEDNILLTALGDMVYNIGIYRSLMDAHYDVGLNKWHDDIKLVASINGSRCNIRGIKYGVMMIDHMAFGNRFAYYNGRAYMAISSLPVHDDLRHLITETEDKVNTNSLRVFNKHLKKIGIDINLCILNEKDVGPSKVIGELLSQYLTGEVRSRYDILTVEVTPLTELIGIPQVMTHYLNIATAESFQKINVAVQRTVMADDTEPNVKPLKRAKKAQKPVESGIKPSDFYLSSVKVS